VLINSNVFFGAHYLFFFLRRSQNNPLLPHNGNKKIKDRAFPVREREIFVFVLEWRSREIIRERERDAEEVFFRLKSRRRKKKHEEDDEEE
jgi:hypothetical protein